MICIGLKTNRSGILSAVYVHLRTEKSGDVMPRDMITANQAKVGQLMNTVFHNLFVQERQHGQTKWLGCFPSAKKPINWVNIPKPEDLKISITCSQKSIRYLSSDGKKDSSTEIGNESMNCQANFLNSLARLSRPHSQKNSEVFPWL